MALGDKTDTVAGESFVVEMLASVIAANGIPSGAAAGIAVNDLRVKGQRPESIRVGIRSTAGSGTMTVTCTVWLYAGGIWFIAKPLNASSAAPHTPVAIPETSADAIAYSECVPLTRGASRIFLEVNVIAGTLTAVTGYAIVG